MTHFWSSAEFSSLVKSCRLEGRLSDFLEIMWFFNNLVNRYPYSNLIIISSMHVLTIQSKNHALRCLLYANRLNFTLTVLRQILLRGPTIRYIQLPPPGTNFFLTGSILSTSSELLWSVFYLIFYHMYLSYFSSWEKTQYSSSFKAPGSSNVTPPVFLAKRRGTQYL